MGVGLSEYRAAIGGFASIAANAKPKSKIKSKQEKPTKPFDRGEEEHSEKDRKSYSAPSSVRRRPFSLNGSRRGSRSRAVGRGSQSLNHADRIIKYRSRSLSCVKREAVAEYSFKNSCLSCKTKMFNRRRQRGRCRQRTREKCNENHCPHIGTELKKEAKDIDETELFFLTSIAVYGCILLEHTIFTIVQMLLVRSGVETNPGPTSQTCCLANQHFKRVKNTIEKTQNNFKSKVTDDTLTKKVIEIEETGWV